MVATSPSEPASRLEPAVCDGVSAIGWRMMLARESREQGSDMHSIDRWQSCCFPLEWMGRRDGVTS